MPPGRVQLDIRLAAGDTGDSLRSVRVDLLSDLGDAVSVEVLLTGATTASGPLGDGAAVAAGDDVR